VHLLARAVEYAGDSPTEELARALNSRSQYLNRHGHFAATVELDALPPLELRRRVAEAIDELIDWDAWERVRRIEEVECQSISYYVDVMKALPQG